MAEQQEEQEPTMEEILASIRRIISEDDAGGADEATADVEAESPAEEPESAPDVSFEDVGEVAEPEEAAPAEADEDVLDLTNRIDDEDEADDLMVIDPVEAPEAAPAPEAPPAPPPAAASARSESIVSENVADETAGAFGSLISNLLVSSRTGEGKTLEDLVCDLLRPMLKDWLDNNLRDIVEARVADEVEKISARARR